MTDFYNVLEQIEDVEGFSYNPFAGKNKNGEWKKGSISIDFLNKHFGHLQTAEDMINATESEGLKLYFAWLRDEKGILS